MVTFQTALNNLAEIKSRLADITAALSEDKPYSDRISSIKEIIEKGGGRWNERPTVDLLDASIEHMKSENERVHSGMAFIAQALGQDSSFVSKVAEEVSENIDASDIADHLSTYDIAQEISTRDVASDIDMDDLASRIDTDDLAASLNIDADSLAEKVVKDNQSDIIVHIVDDMWEHFGNRIKEEGADGLVDQVIAEMARRLAENKC